MNVGAMPSVGNGPKDGFCDVSSSSKVSLNGWCWRMDAYTLRSARARCCGGLVPIDDLRLGGTLPSRWIASLCWPGLGISTCLRTTTAMYTPNHLGRMCHTCMGALCKRHQAGLNADIGRQKVDDNMDPAKYSPTLTQSYECLRLKNPR